MRKINLSAAATAAFFFCAGFIWAAEPPVVNLYWSGAYYGSLNCAGGAEGLARDSDYAFAHGLKLNWDALDFRLFNSCKKTGGSDFWSVKSFGGYEEIFDRRRASLALDFSKRQKVLKTKVAAGSIKLYSQKRLAPFSTVTSPFVASLADSGGLCASLPTKTSSVQPDALYGAASLELPREWSGDAIRLMPIKAEFAVSRNESDSDKAPFLASARGGFFYQNWLKVTGGILWGRYYNEEKSQAAAIDWFDSVPVWKSELLELAAADLCVEIPHLKSRTTFGLAENPGSMEQKNLCRSTLAQELLFSAKNFSLSAAFFASDNLFCGSSSPYVAANAKEYKKLWQAKTTAQMLFKPKNGPAVKIGLGGFVEEQIKDWGKKSERRSLEAKAAAGLQLLAKKDLFKLTAGLGAVTLRQDPSQQKAAPLPKISASAYWSHSFSGGLASQKGAGFAGRIAISGAASFQPELDWQKREWTERFKVAWYPRGLALQSLSAGFSASQKDGKNKLEPSATAAFLFLLKMVRLNASLTAMFPLGW